MTAKPFSRLNGHNKTVLSRRPTPPPPCMKSRDLCPATFEQSQLTWSADILCQSIAPLPDIPNSLCFNTWELRSLPKQWAYGPTLMPWRYHPHTALSLFLIFRIWFLNLKIIRFDFFLYLKIKFERFRTSEGLYVDGISMALVSTAGS